jgi:hypothetical protein
MSKTDYDVYNLYLRGNYDSANAVGMDKNSAVDVLMSVSTSNFDNSYIMTVNILPLYRKIVKKGQTLIEPHTFINRSYESYSFALKIEHDPGKNAEVAEFLMHSDIRIPGYLRSCGLGSFVISRMIDWGKTIQPNALVKPIALTLPDPEDKTARVRRKNFFLKHGFACTFEQATEQTGWATAKSLAQLKSSVNDAKIQKLESTTHEFAVQITELIDLRSRSRSFRDAVDTLQRRNKQLSDQRNIFILVVAFAFIVILVQFMA